PRRGGEDLRGLRRADLAVLLGGGDRALERGQGVLRADAVAGLGRTPDLAHEWGEPGPGRGGDPVVAGSAPTQREHERECDGGASRAGAHFETVCSSPRSAPSSGAGSRVGAGVVAGAGPVVPGGGNAERPVS